MKLTFSASTSGIGYTDILQTYFEGPGIDVFANLALADGDAPDFNFGPGGTVDVAAAPMIPHDIQYRNPIRWQRRRIRDRRQEDAAHHSLSGDPVGLEPLAPLGADQTNENRHGERTLRLRRR
jgi:hypothetical protein